LHDKFEIHSFGDINPNVLISDIEYINTGINQIDKLLQGGIRKKELGVVLAESQHGKTSLLTIIGANSTINKKRVLHLSYEDFYLDVYNSYSRIFTGFNNGSGNLALSLVDCSAEVPSLLDIELIVDKVKPDVVIIDYAELVPFKSDYIGEGKTRFDLRKIFTELRRLANRTNIALWTAHQATIKRDMGGKPYLRLTDDRISECKQIKATSDIMIGLSLNDPFDGSWYLTIMKAKHRPKAIPDFFRVNVDFSVPRIVE